MPKGRLYFGSLASIVLSVALLCPGVIAQSKEKPKLKDFGKSLKRLRWDPKLNQAVATKSKSEGSKPDEDDVIRVETNLVVSDLLILDSSGNPVPDLSANDFVIIEDDQPQKVGMFSLGDNMAIGRSVVLIMDYSGSQFPFIKTSINAAQAMVDKLGPLDRLAIVTDDIALIQDFTTDKALLKKKLGSLLDRINPDESASRHRFGRSQQYSALMATLNEAFNTEDQRPIIILQTDGDQLPFLRNPPPAPSLPEELFSKDQQKEAAKYVDANRTEFSLDDISRMAERSRVTVYTIVSGIKYLGLSQEEQKTRAGIEAEQKVAQLNQTSGNSARQHSQKIIPELTAPQMLAITAQSVAQWQAALAAVATVTGGWTSFLESPSQADEIYSRIFSDINRRYIVGYYPTNKEHDGKRRRINVTIRDHPDYTIVGRRWYYAPSPDQ
jgi:VWFA-related protein